jgi:hypothetical protein
MNPYDGPDDADFGPEEDFDADMITMNPPRWQRLRGRPIAIAGVAIVALAGGAGVGYAATHSLSKGGSTGTTTAANASAPTPSASPSAAPGFRGGPFRRSFAGGAGLGFGGFGGFGIAGGVVHGQVTVPKSGGGYETLDVQQGTVTAVSSTSITVKSADGYSASYVVSTKTLVDAEAAGIGSVKKGDTVYITATVSGSTATAANVTDLTAVKAGRASFGFQVPAHPGSPPTAQSVPVQPNA